jgi:hypothetical protein
MAKYKLSVAAYINDGLRAPGDVVDVPDDFVPGPHMEPFVDGKGVEDKAARKAKDKASKDALPAPGDPAYVGSLIAHTMSGGETQGRVSVASAHPQQSAGPGVVVDAEGRVRGVTPAPVADPPQAPFAKLPGAPEEAMQKAVADDAAAKDGKGPVAAEAKAALDKKG